MCNVHRDFTCNCDLEIPVKYSRNDVISSAVAYAHAGEAQAQRRFTDVLDAYVKDQIKQAKIFGAIAGFSAWFLFFVIALATS